MSSSGDSSLSISVTPPEYFSFSPSRDHPHHTRKRSYSDPLAAKNFLQVPSSKGHNGRPQVRNIRLDKPKSKTAKDPAPIPPLVSKIDPTEPPFSPHIMKSIEKLFGYPKALEDQFSELALVSLLPSKANRFQKFYGVDFTQNPEALSEVLRIANDDFGNIPKKLQASLQNAGRSITSLSLCKVYCTVEKMKSISQYFTKVEHLTLNNSRLSKYFTLLGFSELRQLEINSSSATDSLISELKNCKKLAHLYLKNCDKISIDALIDLLKTNPISMKIEFCKKIESQALQEALLTLASQTGGPLRLKSSKFYETDSAHKARMVFQKSH
jgi:hypothetical protein